MAKSISEKGKGTKTTCLDDKELSDVRKKRCKPCYHKSRRGKKHRILMLVGYSSGPSGVWQRCKDEAIEFVKQGHKVEIHSSDGVKGKPKERAPIVERLTPDIRILRFPYRKLGGESYMSWDSKIESLHYKPTIILAHSYRHTHSDKALKFAKKLGCKSICVTHAPFVKGKNRGFFSRIVVAIKDHFSNIDKFDKIIAVSKWEVPIIKELGTGVWPQKIKRIPNPVPDRYFEDSILSGKGILYLGRYHPIKDLNTLVKGVGKSKSFNEVDFVGSGDVTKLNEIQETIRKSGVKVNWGEPVYDIEAKIKILDDHEIFILSSKREAMPIALVEAMARGKIVIASRTDGARELIKNGYNGFLFDIGDDKQLGEILDSISLMSEDFKQTIREAAKTSVNERKMSEVMKRWKTVLAKI